MFRLSRRKAYLQSFSHYCPWKCFHQQEIPLGISPDLACNALRHNSTTPHNDTRYVFLHENHQTGTPSKTLPLELPATHR